jgi:hypothetical protein
VEGGGDNFGNLEIKNKSSQVAIARGTHHFPRCRMVGRGGEGGGVLVMCGCTDHGLSISKIPHARSSYFCG